jgi:hypothetical protein
MNGWGIPASWIWRIVMLDPCPLCGGSVYYNNGWYVCEFCSWRVRADECGPDTVREKEGWV